ncbi:MAG: right-handed parallel beta-helix repeat-containing protein [Candidatus Yonathbacteria bacterium]|nr:right-handed parallel beta-helix repeat-containing protein [Candidatus Yonathbacteria bacterium]
MSVLSLHAKYLTALLSFLSALVLSAFFVAPAVSFAEEIDAIPGTVSGQGNYFEITDSEYFNVSLDSSEEIDLRMESVPEMITIIVEPVSVSTSTQLTFSGLAPLTKYYKYEDDYHNLAEIVTDANGSFIYIQDLTSPHLIFIQPRKSTKFIADNATGEDCTSIGIWDGATKTCTLTADVNETIQIDSNGVMLDGARHTLTGTGTGFGLFFTNKEGVKIKNFTVSNFRDGIGIYFSQQATFSGNTILNNTRSGINLYQSSNIIVASSTISMNGGEGITLRDSSANIISGNTFSNNAAEGIALYDSFFNILNINTIFSNEYGISFYSSFNNSISDTSIEGHNEAITFYSSHNNWITNTFIRQNEEGITLYSSAGNIIITNTIQQNTDGFTAYSSMDNIVYHNNFINNLNQSTAYGENSMLLSQELPIGGNYWSDFDELAEGCDDADNDTICDAPYVFQSGQDDYPWVKQDGWSSANQAPALFYAEEEGFAADAISSGVHPNKGTASSTLMVFKAVYTGATAPSGMNVLVGNGTATTSFSMVLDTASASTTLRDGIFGNGEQFIATSTLPKGKYQYYLEATAGADAIRLPATTTLSFQTGYSNVAFLPGLLGSRLYKQQVFENKLWEPNWNADVEKLYLTDVGESVDPSIYTNDIIDEAFGFNVYKKFSESMDDLVANGTIKEWQAMPYDWRMDIEDILDGDVQLRNDVYNIMQSVELLAESSDNGQVTILGHSNGGLLGKLLISKLADAGKGDLVDKFIMVGTPQLGTPSALMGLLHGGERGVLKGWLPNHEVARELGENMQSAYNLLPFGGYFSAVDTVAQPIIEFDVLTSATSYLRGVYGNSISALSNLVQFFTGENGVRSEPASSDVDEPNVIDSQLLGNANDIHTTLDQWIPPQGVDVIQIAGWGLDTLRGIRYEEQVKQVCNAELSVCQDLPFLDPRPLFTQDGDKTVVIPSAVAMTTDKYYLNLKNYNKEFIFGGRRNRDHADILEAVPVQDLVKYLVINEQTLPQHITTTKPPIENPTYRLAVHSPVSIHAYDSFGNHTGIIPNTDPTSDIELIEEQIPNSYYLESGEGKYLGLDTGGEYRIELQGEDFGTFTFELQEVLGDEVLNAVEYKNIPVSASTTAELVIQNLNIAPELVLDIDGDGATDAIFTGAEDNDILASMEILRNIVNGLDIHKELKKELIKKLEKAEKELGKGKIEKAVKQFDEIIKKLKEEIEENLEEESEKEDDESDRQEHEKGKDHDGDERKITTENAWMLIGIIEDIKSLLI